MTATFAGRELATVRNRCGLAFGVLAIALAPVQNAYLAGFVLFGIGIAFTLFTANANALVQLSAPDQLRGRLIGLYLFAFLGLAPVGGLLAGSLADIGGTGLASPWRDSPRSRRSASRARSAPARSSPPSIRPAARPL